MYLYCRERCIRHPWPGICEYLNTVAKTSHSHSMFQSNLRISNSAFSRACPSEMLGQRMPVFLGVLFFILIGQLAFCFFLSVVVRLTIGSLLLSNRSLLSVLTYRVSEHIRLRSKPVLHPGRPTWCSPSFLEK